MNGVEASPKTQGEAGSASPVAASSAMASIASPEAKEKAEKAKDEANKLFAAKKYEDAVTKYSEAIELNGNEAVYYSNRAFAYIRQEYYAAALTDATKAIEIDSSYLKGYYRRAVANMALGHLAAALKDFKTVVKLAPNDRGAREKLAECDKEYKRSVFEKAIAFEDKSSKPIEELVGDVDSMVVEDNYNGPKLEGDITLSFVEELLSHLKAQKKLHRKYLYRLLFKVKSMFEADPSLVEVKIPAKRTLTICGDVHGQFYDLLNIFETFGLPSPENPYLFNGDFVDRGSFSIECIVTLFAFKVLYPTSMYLTRGNHETDNMNKVYGFEGECKHKYSEITFRVFSEIFNRLPLAHLVENKILVVHGGLSPRTEPPVTLEEIKNIPRFAPEAATNTLLTDLLWSDPTPLPGIHPSKRGIGSQFGPDITAKFLENNNLDMIIRSHEVKAGGYDVEHDGKCVTVFSAPNYCDEVGNQGAVCRVTRLEDEDYKENDATKFDSTTRQPTTQVLSTLKIKYVTFKAVPHPPVKAMQYAGMLRNMM
ncbi:protein phosphatase 5 [Gaertneriomyces semiglobifer]|nr:protein phosphatase 5 [Gaertneriomyces semiglobifer]